MQQVEQNLKNGRQPKGTKIKVIEGNGVSSQLGLTRSNQFPRNKCTRENCVMCVEESEMGKRMKCESSNIGYEGDCSRCTDNVYIMWEKPAEQDLPESENTLQTIELPLQPTYHPCRAMTTVCLENV